jgi:hypothetical protein
MRRLHTRVADDIREACTHDGVLDREQEAEMRMESLEYRNEVRGFYDEDVEPYDDFDDAPDRDYGDDDEEDDDAEEDGGERDEAPEFDDPMSYNEE